MAADRIGPMRAMWAIKSPDGSPMTEPPRYALARHTVRYVGEPVAIVIAETLSDAQDAAERVEIAYEALPAVRDARRAMSRGAPRVHDTAPGNVCFRWMRGDQDKVGAGFAAAAHVVAIDLVNHRVAGAAIEPRAIVAIPPTG